MSNSLRELIREDAISPMKDEDLDDAIWLFLISRIREIEDLSRYRPEIAVYFASRLIEWDVGNGGFAQAAVNIPEWFSLAAHGYRILGKERAAGVIEEVRELLPTNEEDVEKLRSGEIDWDDYFVGHNFSKYDEWVSSTSDWEITTTRIAYVRANREAFMLD